MLLKPQETIGLQPTTHVVASKLRISYFRPGDGTTLFLGGIRYDHTNPAQDNQHPTFHAQLDDTALASEGDICRHFTYAVDTGQFRCFQHCRIPTADMTLSSVLLCLAADHFPSPFFAKFQKRFVELQDALPHPLIGDFRYSFGLTTGAEAPKHLKSSHWYARQPVQASSQVATLPPTT